MENAEIIRKVAVWIRTPRLPIELYIDKFLWRVGAKLGKMLKLDQLTSFQSRGQFARICIEIDLAKKLVAKIEVLGHVLHLEYEGLHSICFHCGRFGHKIDQCNERTVPAEVRSDGDREPRPNGEAVQGSNLSGPVNRAYAASMNGEGQTNPDDANSEEIKGSNGIEDQTTYGPWMIHKRPNRRKSRNINGRYASGDLRMGHMENSMQDINGIGSRYVSLEINEINPTQDNVNHERAIPIRILKRDADAPFDGGPSLSINKSASSNLGSGPVLSQEEKDKKSKGGKMDVETYEGFEIKNNPGLGFEDMFGMGHQHLGLLTGMKGVLIVRLAMPCN